MIRQAQRRIRGRWSSLYPSDYIRSSDNVVPIQHDDAMRYDTNQADAKSDTHDRDREQRECIHHMSFYRMDIGEDRAENVQLRQQL